MVQDVIQFCLNMSSVLVQDVISFLVQDVIVLLEDVNSFAFKMWVRFASRCGLDLRQDVVRFA